MYYVIKYSGPFGFIKPWTAVRDGETYSQQFLTPSIIEGIRQKLEVTSIIRHKLTYSSISIQQEQTQTRGWKKDVKSKMMVRDKSIVKRGIMINPTLYLALEKKDDAEKGIKQHICLCRNEDLLLPDSEIMEIDDYNFDNLTGFELHFEENEKSFLVGFNRFDEAKPMYGWIEITGKPVTGL
jgi:hypothetical protein